MKYLSKVNAMSSPTDPLSLCRVAVQEDDSVKDTWPLRRVFYRRGRQVLLRIQGAGFPGSLLHVVLNPVYVISHLCIHPRDILLPTANAPADNANQGHVFIDHAYQRSSRVTLWKSTDAWLSCLYT